MLPLPRGPTVAWEEGPPAWPTDGHDVLEIGCGGRDGAKGNRVERTPAGGEHEHGSHTARRLEGPGGDVPVRDEVAGEVQERPECQRSQPRARRSPGKPACGDMEGDDHDLVRQRAPLGPFDRVGASTLSGRS
jgi:hypothetical protein